VSYIAFICACYIAFICACYIACYIAHINVFILRLYVQYNSYIAFILRL
jgi:hypothetical protein